MDAPINVSVYGENTSQSLAQSCLDVIKQADDKLSPYKKGSEIFNLNETKKAENLSQTTREALEKSVELCRKWGHTDVTIGSIVKLWRIASESPQVPNDLERKIALEEVGIENIELSGNSCILKNDAQIDLGCSAKGFACDLALRQLEKENSADYAIVSFGSSTLLYGQKENGSFKVAVKNPNDSAEPALSFETTEAFVSTSGGYERFFEANGEKYIHIFDPETGMPVKTDLTSVTVITALETGGLASDFFSTEIFIAGSENLHDYDNIEGVKYIAIDENGGVYTNADFDITLEDSSFYFK